MSLPHHNVAAPDTLGEDAGMFAVTCFIATSFSFKNLFTFYLKGLSDKDRKRQSERIFTSQMLAVAKKGTG